jgi:hypothetical protein
VNSSFLVRSGYLFILINFLCFFPILAIDKNLLKIPEINWEMLNKMKKHNDPPDNLTDLDGKQVRIAGFMVPLEEYEGYEVFTNPEIANIGKFILVPGMGMCTHVPPPPENQMVYVVMKKGYKSKFSWDPIWIVGIFRLKRAFSPFGKPFFRMEGEQVIQYDK